MRVRESCANVICLVLLALTPIAAFADTGASCSFVMQMDMPALSRPGAASSTGRTVIIHGKAWQSGKNARIEMSPAGQPNRVVIITPTAVYTLQPGLNKAVMKPMDAQLAEKMFGGFPLLFLTPLNPAKRWKDAKLTGSEKVDGITCDIWKVDLPGPAGQEASIWVPHSKQPAAPVKAKMSVPTPQMTSGKLTTDGPPLKCTVNVSNVEQGKQIPSYRFVVPKEYVVQVDPMSVSRKTK